MAVAVVAVSLVAACGGSGTTLSAEEEAVAVAIEAKMAEEIEESEDPLADAEVRLCFARGMVGHIGLDRLAELGVTADSVAEGDAVFGGMTESELEGVAAAVSECVDISATFQAELESSGIGSTSAACLVDRLEESDFFEQAFLAGILGDEFAPDASVLATLISAASECLSDEELEAFFGG